MRILYSIEHHDQRISPSLASDYIIEIAYFVAAVLFILALKWLSSPVTARRGVLAGEIGMVLAIVGTLFHHEIVDYRWIAVALVGLSKLVDLGFENLERGGPWLLDAAARAPAPAPASAPAERPAALLIGFLGAGVYEEALFRLLLVPLSFGLLRLLQAPAVLASTLAVTASALLFSLAHHAGTPGEAFTWFAFIFRWLAGVYFAWVFVIRGFGVAVGTHTAYDILVGAVGWHL